MSGASGHTKAGKAVDKGTKGITGKSGTAAGNAVAGSNKKAGSNPPLKQGQHNTGQSGSSRPGGY
jgi:hypothetical protein